jgi:predicted small metal-binding protein
MNTKSAVDRAVDKLFEEIRDHQGREHEFNKIDADVREEIRQKWSAIIATELATPPDAWATEDDKPLAEQAQIDAAFPTRSKNHNFINDALRMVGAKFTKWGLVALVHWLLMERAQAKKDAEKFWGLLCDTTTALGLLMPEKTPYLPDYAKHFKERYDARDKLLREIQKEMESGYIVGSMLEKYIDKINACVNDD